MKLCNTCQIEKEENEFSITEYKRKSSKCKKCVMIYNRSYRQENKEILIIKQAVRYQNNKEEISEYNKEYYQKNKEIILVSQTEYYIEYKEQRNIYQKIYYQNNKKIISDKKKEYYQENKENILFFSKEYYRKHKEEHNISMRNYRKKRQKNDPAFKLRSNVSRLINIVIKNNGGKKNNLSILNYLPYTVEKLKQHLESQFEPWMNWRNQGIYSGKTWNDNDPETWTWQLDHIIPQSDLFYISMEDENFKKCWALENLRPLSSKQNHTDGVNRTRHKKKE